MQEHLKEKGRFHDVGARINEPLEALLTMLAACVGHDARIIFTGNHSPHKILHVNDYNVDKSFVYAIMVLSVLCGCDGFPCGIYNNWPPVKPTAVHSHDMVITSNEPRDRVSTASSSGGVH